MVEVADIARAARPDRNASAGASADSASLPRQDAIDAAAWADLARRAVEPNGYYLPEWAIAVDGTSNDAGRFRALTATADESEPRLTGLLPVVSAWRVWALPLPVLVSADPYHALDTPLLDRDSAEAAATQMLRHARASGAHALVLRLLPVDGAASAAFTRALAAQNLRPRLLGAHSRACLDATRDADALLREGLGPKKLKDLRRLRHRLAEHGAVVFAVARTPADVGAAFDLFLRLEASGWKAARGTALAQDAAEARRLRQAATSLAAQGLCEIVTLHAGATPVAAGIVLRHQDRAFFFKLGIDPAFGRYSPGVQLTLDLTRHLCADPAIACADSTAGPDHPMIDSIWRGRLSIGDWFIPLAQNDPVVPLAYAAILVRESLRAAAARLLHGIRRHIGRHV